MDMQILQQINHWAACAQLTSECSSVVHADLLEKAADHITSIESQLETARKRITELENAALVPGVLHCAKCNFQLSKTNLYMKSGTTGPGDNKSEPCPNGCGPLWPDTWKRSREELCSRLNAAEAALSAASEKLKGEQVPVAVIVLSKNWPDAGRKVIDYYLEKIQHLPVGTELFTAPQKPINIDESVIRDANRYRFLRDEDSWGEDSDSWDWETKTGLISWENLCDVRLDDFDAAIDARMAASDIPPFNVIKSGFTVEGEPAPVKYIVILQRAWCNDSGSGINYHSDLIAFDKRDKAIKYGFELQDSDDFNIGVLTNGVLTSFDWMAKPLAETKDSLARIANRIGIEGNADAE
ncbi:hypothetical protein [Yersinia enterocolitica]